MSVTILFVRYVEAQQVNCPEMEEDYVSLCTEDLPSCYRSYYFFEIGSMGWEGGARFRVKRIAVERALAYANKLHAGGWIDDDNYGRLYGAIEGLGYKLRSILGDSWMGGSTSSFRFEK